MKTKGLCTSRPSNCESRASDIVYVATLSTGIFKTTDGGVPWTAINNGVPVSTGINPGPAVFVIRVDPVQPSALLAGAYPALIRSSDGGATWQTVNAPGASGFAFDWGDIAFDPKMSGLVYVASYTNLLNSTDHGATWT
ncbi:MAG TPA: hypothetical protein VEH47_07880, partial [Candidatus Acidoferrales bacterium]|nr:hypothetical protein [Candidatus Acidoferrales bacterium]